MAWNLTEPSKTIYVGSGDGYVQANNANWDTLKALTTGASATVAPETIGLGQATLSGGTHYLETSFFPFDTGAVLPDDCTVLSAVFSTYVFTGGSDENATEWVLVPTTQASTSTLATSDFHSWTATDCGRKDGSDFTSSAYYTWTTNANLVAQISKTGITKLGIVNSLWFDNSSAPAGVNQWTGIGSGGAGTTNEAKLVVTYSLEYPTRMKLTIDQTKVDADLTDFPVLVKLTSSNFDFSKANADGFDIRFTASDGTTLLKYERLRHDSANSLAEYWVKVPTVSGASDTDIYMYYRTTDTADGADPTNVWDANYKAVYHLNGSYGTGAGEVKDSTANALHGTCADAPTQADGKVSKCQDFNGSSDYINLANVEFLYSEDWSVEVVMSTDETSNTYRTMLGCYYGTPSIMHYNDTRKLSFNSFNNKNIVIPSSSVAQSAFYHLQFDYNWKSAGPTQADTAVYQNGASVDTSVNDSYGANSTSYVLGWDTDHNAGRNWDGKVEELRFSKGVYRGAAWAKASYNACWNTLLTYGAEETGEIGFKINIGDAWKVVSAIKLNIGDSWKTVTHAKINIGDVWKTIF